MPCRLIIIFDELKMLTEQQFEMKEREKTVNVAEMLAHALHCYEHIMDVVKLVTI